MFNVRRLALDSSAALDLAYITFCAFRTAYLPTHVLVFCPWIFLSTWLFTRYWLHCTCTPPHNTITPASIWLYPAISQHAIRKPTACDVRRQVSMSITYSPSSLFFLEEKKKRFIIVGTITEWALGPNFPRSRAMVRLSTRLRESHEKSVHYELIVDDSEPYFTIFVGRYLLNASIFSTDLDARWGTPHISAN